MPDLLVGEVLPACRIFPDNSGGFITTDIQNIVRNPAIIDEISDQIEKVKKKKKACIRLLVY